MYISAHIIQHLKSNLEIFLNYNIFIIFLLLFFSLQILPYTFPHFPSNSWLLNINCYCMILLISIYLYIPKTAYSSCMSLLCMFLGLTLHLLCSLNRCALSLGRPRTLLFTFLPLCRISLSTLDNHWYCSALIWAFMFDVFKDTIYCI